MSMGMSCGPAGPDPTRGPEVAEEPTAPKNPLRATLAFGRRYPIVSITVVVGAVGLIVWFTRFSVRTHAHEGVQP